MKIIFFLSFSFLFQVSIIAQNCPLPNGDFELWGDVTAEFDESGELDPGTTILPEGYFGLIRLLFIAFGELFEILGESDAFDLSSNLFGVKQSIDATTGEYAMQISGDSFIPVADLTGLFPCDGELPGSFSFDLKHVGPGPDTINIVCTVGPDGCVPFDTEYLDEYRGYSTIQLIFDEDTEYQSYNLPFTDNFNGLEADTIAFIAIVSGNQAVYDADLESYFLLDNVKLNSDNVLSVNFSDVTVFDNESHHLIKWASYQNEFTQYFEVERSFENPNRFLSLGKVASLPGEQTRYQFKDFDAKEQGVYYYRIKEVNDQGALSYSDVISIEKDERKVNNALVIFPNPIEEELQFTLSLKEAKQNIFYAILDANGKLITDNRLLKNTLEAGVHTLTVGLGNLTPGLYYLRLSGSNLKFGESFLIVD